MSGDNKTAIIVIGIVAFTAIMCTYIYGDFSYRKEIEITKQFELGIVQSKDRTAQMKYVWKSDSINSFNPFEVGDTVVLKEDAIIIANDK